MSPRASLLLLLLFVAACGGAEAPGAPTSSATSVASAKATAASPKASLRFVAVGDTGRGTPAQRAVGDAIAAKCAASGCDFVQLLGDNFYMSGVESTTDPQWKTAFEEPYMKVDAPFWVVLGNHDDGGNGQGDQPERGAVQVEYAKNSKKWHLPARYWHREVGGVEMVGLDTNAAVYKNAAAQRADVAKWLTESKATWRVVFGHHPYRSNGPHGNAGSYDPGVNNGLDGGVGFKALFDEAVCGKADLYLAGHDHSLQWLADDCGGTALVVSGAGATATTLPGKNAKYFETLELGFVWVEITGTKLVTQVIDKTGKLLFERVIAK